MTNQLTMLVALCTLAGWAAAAVAQQPAPPALAPPAPPAEIEPPRRYADQGTSRVGLVLGFGTGGGGSRYAAGADYGYFVVQQVAPGAEALVSGGSGLLTTGFVMANLHVIPLRTSSFALTLAGRGGRVLISDHSDGWGVGGSAGLILFTGAHVGLQVAYQYLRLYPTEFCGDLVPNGCSLQGLQLGIVAGF